MEGVYSAEAVIDNGSFGTRTIRFETGRLARQAAGSATVYLDDETVVLSARLKAMGCDFIDVSSGGLDPRQKVTLAPSYQVPFAARIRREAGIPTMAVGLITEAEQAERIVASGEADLVALGRAIMDDPRWAWRAAAALGADAPYASQYVRAHPKVWPGAKKRAA